MIDFTWGKTSFVPDKASPAVDGNIISQHRCAHGNRFSLLDWGRMYSQPGQKGSHVVESSPSTLGQSEREKIQASVQAASTANGSLRAPGPPGEDRLLSDSGVSTAVSDG